MPHYLPPMIRIPANVFAYNGGVAQSNPPGGALAGGLAIHYGLTSCRKGESINALGDYPFQGAAGWHMSGMSGGWGNSSQRPPE